MKKVEVFGNMDPVPAGVYSEIYSNTQMDIDGRMEIFEVQWEEHIVRQNQNNVLVLRRWPPPH